jgi:hypothetical protein
MRIADSRSTGKKDAWHRSFDLSEEIWKQFPRRVDSAIAGPEKAKNLAGRESSA